MGYHRSCHGSAVACATVGLADMAVVLVMVSYGKPPGHVYGKTHVKARGGNAGGNIHGKTPTCHPIPFGYFDPSVGPSYLAPCSHQ